MIDNSSIAKLFIRVPKNVSFDGAAVSGASGNEKKIYFNENDNTIWNNGQQFSLDTTQRTALQTLIGSDTAKSVRTIASEVINSVIGTGDDSTEVIDRLKEVLDWFHNLPESDAGALDLVGKVGHPASAAVYYTQEEIDNAQEGDDAYGKKTSDVKTPAVQATGLYAEVATAVAGGLTSADAKSGELLIDANVVGQKVEVESTTKLQNAVSAAETSIQTLKIAGQTASITGDANAKSAEISKAHLQSALFTNSHESTPLSYSYLGVSVSLKESNGELTYLNIDASELANRVTTLEAFDPWETYQAPAQEQSEPEQQP